MISVRLGDVVVVNLVLYILAEDDKHSGSGGSLGEAGIVTNGNGHASTSTGSTGPSLHSSDESLQTNDSRRSLTPAHLCNSENDITGNYYL